MRALIADPAVSERLIAARRAAGADHHDEVWQGIYVMARLPNNEHQELVLEIGTLLREAIMVPGLGKVLPGTNLTDREEDWTANYRCPDLAVFLKDTRAENRGSYWVGGPDLAVEIVSPGDQTREKIHFYAAIHTGELLIVDRDPWQLELLRFSDGKLAPAGVSTVGRPDWVTATSVSLAWRLQPGSPRPRLEVRSTSSDRTWCV